MRSSRRLGRAGGLTLGCVALLISGRPLAGVQGAEGARATLDVDAVEFTVGDRINATLAIVHSSDETVAWPDSIDPTPFEVLEFSPGPPRIDGQRAISTASLVLTVFELGELEIPPIEVVLIGPDGDRGRVITDPFAVGIVSVGLDEGQDIRDVKGPRSIARDWLLMWPWFVLALLLGSLAYWLVRRVRDRAPTSEPAPVERAGTPHEIAHAALDRLEASALLERGEVKAFHIEVSLIVRAYVESRFGIDALEMTTREVMVQLETRGIDPSVLGECHRFFVACDLVKFAKRRPADSESRALIGVARRFVDATIPEDPVEEGSVEAEAGEADEEEAA